MRRGRPKGSVKGQIAGVPGGRFRLDIAAALAFGAGLAAPAGAAAGQPVERGVQPPGIELFPRVNLVAPLPPMAVLGGSGDDLAGRVGRMLGLRLAGFTF